MISSLELRQIVESGFLPLKCVCTIDSDGRMTVSLFQAEKGHASFIAEGILTENLTTCRNIANLVAELKEQFRKKGFDNAEPRRRLG
ncbi:MAG TPA: DUF1652 domain-containing protein [Pseudomonas sp.]|jgi:hypothetical protein